jgi:hypothetical protein
MTNSDASTNPNGGEADWRRSMQPALEINLMERILAPGNLHRAWKQVKSNKGASGTGHPNYLERACIPRLQTSTAGLNVAAMASVDGISN